MWKVRVSQMASASRTYSSMKGTSSSGLRSTLRKPRSVLTWVSLGMEASSTSLRQAAALASAVGTEARACAARSRPVVVRSRLSSAAISSSPARPAATRPMSSSQRRSWSTTSPSSGCEPLSQAATAAVCSSVTA